MCGASGIGVRSGRWQARYVSEPPKPPIASPIPPRSTGQAAPATRRPDQIHGPGSDGTQGEHGCTEDEGKAMQCVVEAAGLLHQRMVLRDLKLILCK